MLPLWLKIVGSIGSMAGSKSNADQKAEQDQVQAMNLPSVSNVFLTDTLTDTLNDTLTDTLNDTTLNSPVGGFDPSWQKQNR